ncbi:carbohydrate ABC transporter substrate-binding protein [Mesorhizobium sp. M2D.F.Ca.ET.185.01.1.1]|uniref:ABC transporter substrate-binding protein n=3 Tax=Mesorhizobium TaxID=68287 RepID=UPI000FCAA845|nr:MULTISPECIES: ABC transporter substrate-binding protein [unclassified Mesorhizobium]RVD57543.1 carbohydrate ABC transporter substrate-binding protein [Mesorhizobium sp. M2D.F.Ca.ET.140.01.1.1]TGP77380.1 carbohydrate ABC transporter substrate-binding protein [bacterium M00.F.Ca.ET.227.01.1.1]TGP93175.1 carbohydrate ABC transporter substrate-binding protein [bacterium M00.F.Ca.ET.222.01.1.1]TGP96721.1 carbohydrate ABC transporter substrate-binding protein [bacterium M00.F.Ca.ET.221.01.1.1]TGQ
MRSRTLLLGAAICGMMSATAQAEEKSIEVIHHWVSDSEVAAVNTIKQELEKHGVIWKDAAIGGANGVNAEQSLRARIVAGNPPGAMQMLGYDASTWAKEGVLRDLTDLETANGGADLIPPDYKRLAAPDGKWVEVPINLHRSNWIWANKKAFDAAGIGIPKTWDELIASGEKLRKAGIIPLAASDEAWQVAKIFDSLIIDLNGPEFYTRVALKVDDKAIRSPEMVKVFEKLRQVRGLVDDNFVGRDWAVASEMVASGKAGMQIMGDWAKGEFLAKNLKPGVDFLCFPTPTSTPNFLWAMDSFSMFETTDPNLRAAQDELVKVILDPEVQIKFNLIKGSIPPRLGVDMSKFDDCAKQAAADLKTAIDNKSFLGTLSGGYAAEPQFAAIFKEVAGKFFVSDMSAQDAVTLLADEIDNAR